MTAIPAMEYRQSTHESPLQVRQAVLERAARGERIAVIARDTGIPANTIYGWVDRARREYLIAIGRRLVEDRGDLMSAGERVQYLLDAIDLPAPEKRTLQSAITELVVAAMRRG